MPGARLRNDPHHRATVLERNDEFQTPLPDAWLEWRRRVGARVQRFTFQLFDTLHSLDGNDRRFGFATGQVTYVDGYIVGRKKLIETYRCLMETYPEAETIYVIQDNWSIHSHPDVLEALAEWPQIKPIWLPTYAPWLNAIEKLWRWLREYVLKMHRLADDPVALRKRVNTFLDQFASGSESLLH